MEKLLCGFLLLVSALAHFTLAGAASVVAGQAGAGGVSAIISPDSGEIGQPANIWMGAVLNGTLYLRNGPSTWAEYRGGPLPIALTSAALPSSLQVSIVNFDVSSVPGLDVYVGYGSTEADLSLSGHLARVYTTNAADAIFLAPANPVNVTVTKDSTRVVTQLVGVGGGTLSATDANGNQYTLTIPANALTEDTAIQMTPITGMTGASVADKFVAGVQFAPDGLSLEKVAVLTIVPATAVPLDRQTLFAAQGNGNDLHLAIPGLDPAQIQVRILHFSQDGLLKLTANERTQLIAQNAVDEAARLEAAIADIYTEHRSHEINGFETPLTPEEADTVLADLTSYYNLVVLPRILIAATNCDNAMLALRTLEGYDRMRQLLGLETHPNSPADYARISEAFTNIGRSCAYIGSGTLTTSEYSVVTKVRWNQEKSTGKIESYRPSAGNLTLTVFDVPCLVIPETVPIDPDNGGLLVVDYNATPPTYTGYGLNNFVTTLICKDGAYDFSAVALFLGGLGSVAQGQVVNNLITGTQAVPPITLDWIYRGCNWTIPGDCSLH